MAQPQPGLRRGKGGCTLGSAWLCGPGFVTDGSPAPERLHHHDLAYFARKETAKADPLAVTGHMLLAEPASIYWDTFSLV